MDIDNVLKTGKHGSLSVCFLGVRVMGFIIKEETFQLLKHHFRVVAFMVQLTDIHSDVEGITDGWITLIRIDYIFPFPCIPGACRAIWPSSKLITPMENNVPLCTHRQTRIQHLSCP